MRGSKYVPTLMFISNRRYFSRAHASPGTSPGPNVQGPDAIGPSLSSLWQRFEVAGKQCTSSPRAVAFARQQSWCAGQQVAALQLIGHLRVSQPGPFVAAKEVESSCLCILQPKTPVQGTDANIMEKGFEREHSDII